MIHSCFNSSALMNIIHNLTKLSRMSDEEYNYSDDNGVDYDNQSDHEENEVSIQLENTFYDAEEVSEPSVYRTVLTFPLFFSSAKILTLRNLCLCSNKS